MNLTIDFDVQFYLLRRHGKHFFSFLHRVPRLKKSCKPRSFKLNKLIKQKLLFL